jgi:hypothetical protein
MRWMPGSPYGCINVYELGPLLDVRTTKIVLVKSTT